MFLNPFMLFGLTAVSVPIIIHLLNRRKFERVVWAAMRFLRLSVEQNQRRIRIEDMLLLILRCLLVALLALALARPVLKAAAGLLGPAAVTSVVVLDNSYSMSLSDGVQTRFDAAKKAAEQVLSNMPSGSSSAVLLASDQATAVIPEPTFDLTLAIRQIKDAPLFDRPTNLLPAIREAIQTLEGRPTIRKEIYIITDGQLLGWRQIDQIKSLLDQYKDRVRANLIFVGSPEERNLGITSIQLDGGLSPVNTPMRLEVRVKNHGRAEARDVNVAIAADNDPAMDQAVIAAIPAGEERSITLFGRLKTEGYHTVTAKIDFDRLPADDTRTVAVRAVKELKVLLIDGDTGREARDSEVFFLKAALRPVPRAEWDDFYIKLTTRNPTELEAVRFEDFDAVISANVTDFSQTALNQITTYVRGGGGLMVFPGDNINVAYYNEQLFQKSGLLPASLGQPRGDAKAQEKWFSLQDRNYQHSIVTLWRDPAAGTLSSAKFFRVYDLVEPKAGPGKETKTDSRVIVRFADNAPAMMERDFGLGRVILFASTADTAWNDLGARAGIFVPLIHRSLGYLVARQDENLTVRAGQPFIHTAPVELLGKDALVTKSVRPYAPRAGDFELHESRRIEMVDGSATLRFDQTSFAGPYQISVGDAHTVRFAAQSDPEESDLSSLTDEQYKLLADVAHVVRWQGGNSLRDEIAQSRLGTELWLPLAILVLVLATLETLLAHWFSKSK